MASRDFLRGDEKKPAPREEKRLRRARERFHHVLASSLRYSFLSSRAHVPPRLLRHSLRAAAYTSGSIAAMGGTSDISDVASSADTPSSSAAASAAATARATVRATAAARAAEAARARARENAPRPPRSAPEEPRRPRAWTARNGHPRAVRVGLRPAIRANARTRDGAIRRARRRRARAPRGGPRGARGASPATAGSTASATRSPLTPRAPRAGTGTGTRPNPEPRAPPPPWAPPPLSGRKRASGRGASARLARTKPRRVPASRLARRATWRSGRARRRAGSRAPRRAARRARPRATPRAPARGTARARSGADAWRRGRRRRVPATRARRAQCSRGWTLPWTETRFLNQTRSGCFPRRLRVRHRDRASVLVTVSSPRTPRRACGPRACA